MPLTQASFDDNARFIPGLFLSGARFCVTRFCRRLSESSQRVIALRIHAEHDDPSFMVNLATSQSAEYITTTC